MITIIITSSVIGFICGLFIGGILINIYWISNSKQIQRILYQNEFYKTVKLSDSKSWEFLEVHKNEQKT